MASNNDEIEDGGGGTPGDNTDASLSSIDFGALLTNSSSADGVGFPLASGINVVRVAQAIIGSIAFSVLLGVNSVISTLSDVYSGLIDGLGGFFGDRLIGATLGAGVSAIEGAWSFSLDEFGFGAYLIGLGVVIATFYVADRGADAALEVLR